MRTRSLALALILGATPAAQRVTTQPAGAAKRHKIRVLLVTGQNNHDWEYTHEVHAKMLEKTGRFAVTITKDPEKTFADAEELAKHDVIFLDYNRGKRWPEPCEKNFTAAVKGGMGVSVIHAANNAFPGWVEYETIVGLLWRRGTGHGNFHEFDVEVTDRQHPITRNLRELKAQPDELYHKLVHLHGAKFRVLMQAFSSKQSRGIGRYEPMCTVAHYGKGRIFHTPLGHVWRKQEPTRRSINTPQFQLLVARGTEWAATGHVSIEPRDFGLEPIPPNKLTRDEKKAGWRLLFDGTSTSSWRGYRKEGFPQKGWTVQDGALSKTRGAGGDLITRETFGDFEFQCEWNISKGGNSGIIYLCTEAKNACWMTGPELQVLDDRPKNGGGNPRTSAGALYGLVACEDKHLEPAGKWNHVLIRVRHPRVEHWLNGRKVLSYDLESEDFLGRVAKSKFRKHAGFAKARKGHIALQDHGSPVRYRSLKVRRIVD